MVDVQTEVLISAPVDKVVAYASNPDHAPEWYANISKVEWKTEKPLIKGSQITFKAHFLRKELSYTYEVASLSKNIMVMQTAEGPFPMETTYTWEEVDQKTTRMTLRNRGKPRGFSKLMAPFMAYMIRRANLKDLRCIKRILENEE